MFFVAGELFNFEFTAVPEGSVPVFHEDMTVYEVTNRTSGEHVGLWYLDPYARLGKRSGAWATAYRSHETFDGKRTVLAANNSNFVKGAPGEAVLISWTTLRLCSTSSATLCTTCLRPSTIRGSMGVCATTPNSSRSSWSAGC